MGRSLKEYGAYHAWYNVAQWKTSSGVYKGKIAKAYGNNSRCLSILVVCYFRMGAKMRNVGDGESKFPIRQPRY